MMTRSSGAPRLVAAAQAALRLSLVAAITLTTAAGAFTPAPTPARAQSGGFAEVGLDLAWSGTISFTDEGPGITIPPRTVTSPAGSSVTSKFDSRFSTSASITVVNGQATASVSPGAQSELSAVYTGCWNGRWAMGGESRHSGSTEARVGVSVADDGTFRITGYVPGGVAGTARQYQTFEGPNSDCNGLTVDFAAVGITPGTVSDTSPSTSDSISFEIEGKAAPGATTLSGSGPVAFGTGTVTYSLTGVGCDPRGTDEATRIVERESARFSQATEDDSDMPDDLEGLTAPLTLFAGRSSGLPRQVSQALSSPSVVGAVRGAFSRPDRVSLDDDLGGTTSGLVRLAVRLGAGGQALPTLESIERMLGVTCIQPGSIEGARTLLLGSVQWVGNEFRINLRTVDTQTGVITRTVSDRGRGGSGELGAALAAAVATFVRG